LRVIAKRTLRKFWQPHADAEQPLKAWHHEAAAAEWTGPKDVKARFASASFIGNDRVVFNIGGNRYRLIVAIKYASQIVFVRFIGTHSEYDKVDAAKVQR
jgi:mRNA interferase HigB